MKKTHTHNDLLLYIRTVDAQIDKCGKKFKNENGLSCC